MKNLMLICLSLALANSVWAQSGTVVYNETMKFEIHLDGDAAEFQNLLPKENTTTRLLHYTPDASLYLNKKQGDQYDAIEEREGGGTMVIKMQEPLSQLYLDIKNQKVLEQQEFMSRTFLIESKVDSIAWKLTGNRRDILGFPCMEAVYKKDSSITLAWFTPSIEVSSGPGNYRGLPGLILEVNVNNGKKIIKAESVTSENVTQLIIKPKNGKKVSKKEFDKIVEEKSDGQKHGSGGTYMIKISR